ncbi:hypothetical protein [Hymenobacter sp. PAMC 26628]|uniref:hypothetical protein n=1 Tax=Hymenobacter sp. PAMC 26628 TaxID=1484118 RepID=UPI000A4D6C66|nr:hypothetical protein [Hymenobacter sp. PAMC 26628]
MGASDNKKPQPTGAPTPTKEERLAQAREYAKQFKFDTLSEEDLIRLRRNAYKYAI